MLSHPLPDATEAPVAFYSRTLFPVERNYAQIDGEALAIVAGVKKFHDCMYDHPFEIRTNCRPVL